MPRCTGLEATRIIKEQWSSKKVIIATMHASPFYWKEAHRAGADGILLKGSPKSLLQEVIRLCIESLQDVAGPVVGGKQQQEGRENIIGIKGHVPQESAV